MKDQDKETKKEKVKVSGSKKAPAKPKIPGFCKKPIPQRIFEKRYAKFIPHPGDKKFFGSCFELADGKMTIRGDLTAEQYKKLSALWKVIKANRKGALKVLPLTVFALFIAALVIFFTVFMNPLLERAIETGMEALFEAKVDVDHFNLNLFRFRVGIDAVTIANRDEPMKNLIQIGRMEFRLKPEAVLRGKVYIEEIRTDSIRFGTARSVSGALPEKPAKVKPAKVKSEAPPLVDLQNFDAMGLLNREFDKLNTPKLYDSAINAYNESLEKWKNQVELTRTRGNELVASAQPVLNLNVNNLQNIEAITTAVQDITALVNNVQTAANDAAVIVNGLESDIKTAVQLEQSARSAITDDLNHLKSYLDLGSGAAFSALEPSIREILSDTAEQYMDYGFRALEVLEKLKASQDAKPKKEKPPKAPAFKGRDVAFPTRAYPAFFLGILATDFTIENWRTGFDLRGVSSNPDLSGVPVTLALSLAETSSRRAVDFKGSADFRTSAADLFSADIGGSGFPVSLEKELAQTGIGGFRGDVGFDLDFSGRKDGGVSGGGTVGINQAELIDPAGTIAQAVDSAIREAKDVHLGIRYVHDPSAKDEFSITTNIGDLVKSALDRIVRAYAKQAADELERVLREQIAKYIDGKFLSKDELDTLMLVARGDKAALDKLKGSLETKKNEFEQKIKNAANQAVEQAKDEAQKQGEQAIKDVLEGKTPSLQAPTLPGLPGGLKLPGR